MLGVVIAVVLVAALAALTVHLVRLQRTQSRRLEALTAELDRERERTAALAVAEQRAQIARELRDVVADRLNAIAVQAEAPELNALRQAAEEALGELRRLLGLLGEDAEPHSGLAQLPGLVQRARAAGMPVTLHVDGTPRPLPASLDLSAFRIVQEALANVHKHARGAPATVRVTWRLQSVALQIRDTGTGRHADSNGESHGLVGMRERAKLHGGELHAAPLPGGGFEVTARLPL